MSRTTLPAVLAACLVSLPAFAGTKAFDAQMKPVLEQYLVIQKALAADSTKGVAPAARKIEALSKKLDPSTVTGEHAAHYKDLPTKLGAAAAAVASAKDLASAREAFKGLSRPLAMWAQMSKPDKTWVLYCPMAKSSWVQASADVHNPYYGASMLTCGELVAGPGAKAPAAGAQMKDMHGMKSMSSPAQ